LQGLSRLLPGVPVVSEEAAAKSAQLKARSGSFVLVDPLDVRIHDQCGNRRLRRPPGSASPPHRLGACCGAASWAEVPSGWCWRRVHLRLLPPAAPYSHARVPPFRPDCSSKPLSPRFPHRGVARELLVAQRLACGSAINSSSANSPMAAQTFTRGFQPPANGTSRRATPSSWRRAEL
jgi:hypothetical protein